MTEEIKLRLISDISEIEALLRRYVSETTEILTTDIDETLEEILGRRKETVDLIGEKRADIDLCAGELSSEEADILKRIISNNHVPLGISKELREIHKAAVNMRSVLVEAKEKDKQAALRVDARVKELRSELENVNDDKRKVDLYSNTPGGNKGGSFDSHL